MKNNTSIENRIQYLEDIESIKKLQATYGHYCDKGWNGKEFTDVSPLLSDDAELHFPGDKDAKGATVISDMLKNSSVNYEITQHSFSNPIIDINGDKATGKWLLFVAIKLNGISNMVYQSEDVEYVRASEGWRISSLSLHFAHILRS